MKLQKESAKYQSLIGDDDAPQFTQTGAMRPMTVGLSSSMTSAARPMT